MKNFLSLKAGTIINLNAIAYIRAARGSLSPPKLGSVCIVFPAVTSSETGYLCDHFDLTLEGDEAEEFLAEIAVRGIAIDRLQEARKPRDH
jgi:hypothetical protein